MASLVIARIEDAPAHFPSAWLLLRALAGGWMILFAWATLGVLLGVLTRGTSLAIGVGILYALVIEGLLSAFADSVSVLEPLTQVFLRANGYSLARGARRLGGRDRGERPGRLLRHHRRQPGRRSRPSSRPRQRSPGWLRSSYGAETLSEQSAHSPRTITSAPLG